MKRISLLQLSFCSLLLASAAVSAQSSGIYSWTDENGVKHYSDKAPTDVNTKAEEVKIIPPPVSALPDDSGINDEQALNGGAEPTDEEAAAPLSYADQQRQALQKQRAENEQAKAERNRACMEARNQLAKVEPNRRVFYTDDNGDTVRLDDEQRILMVNESKARIAEFCD